MCNSSVSAVFPFYYWVNVGSLCGVAQPLEGCRQITAVYETVLHQIKEVSLSTHFLPFIQPSVTKYNWGQENYFLLVHSLCSLFWFKIPYTLTSNFAPNYAGRIPSESLQLQRLLFSLFVLRDNLLRAAAYYTIWKTVWAHHGVLSIVVSTMSLHPVCPMGRWFSQTG